MTKELSSVKKLERETESWQTKFLALQSGLQGARHAKAKAEAERAEVVLDAKIGDLPAQKKLAELTNDWLRAIAEVSDFETAIKQCEEKIINLEKARLQAQRREKENKLGELVDELLKQAADFDHALAQFVIPLAEVMRQSSAMASLADELGVHGSVTQKVRQLLTNILLDKVAVFNLADFPRPQPAFRNKTLAELVRHLFKQVLEPDGGQQKKSKRKYAEGFG